MDIPINWLELHTKKEWVLALKLPFLIFLLRITISIECIYLYSLSIYTGRYLFYLAAQMGGDATAAGMYYVVIFC